MKTDIARRIPARLDHLNVLGGGNTLNIEMSGCAMLNFRLNGGAVVALALTEDEMTRLSSGAHDIQIDYIYTEDGTPLPLAKEGRKVAYGVAWIDLTPRLAQNLLAAYRKQSGIAKARKPSRPRPLSSPKWTGTLASREDFSQAPYALLPFRF